MTLCLNFLKHRYPNTNISCNKLILADISARTIYRFSSAFKPNSVHIYTQTSSDLEHSIYPEQQSDDDFRDAKIACISPSRYKWTCRWIKSVESRTSLKASVRHRASPPAGRRATRGRKKANWQVRHESCFPPSRCRAMSAGCLFMAAIQRHRLYRRICMSIVYLTPSGQEFYCAHGLQFTTVYFGTAL